MSVSTPKGVEILQTDSHELKYVWISYDPGAVSQKIDVKF